jgi:hypothetical protein
MYSGIVSSHLINFPYFQNQQSITMSRQVSLDSLHSSLSLETAKLVSWEVETVVIMRDRESQI